MGFPYLHRALRSVSDEDPRPGTVTLLARAITGLRAAGVTARPRARGDTGYFSATIAKGLLELDCDFAIGVPRNKAVWRLLDGIDQDAWTPATDMEDAEVAVAVYRPAGWPQDISCLVRRVKLAAEQISTDPRARRRRTIPTGQLALALEGVAEHVHGYSFIITNLDVSTPERAAAVEHWYRHRTDIEDRIRDAKHGAALRHLPSVRPTRSGCGAHCWPSTCPHGYRHSAASTTTTGPAARTFTPCAGGY